MAHIDDVRIAQVIRSLQIDFMSRERMHLKSTASKLVRVNLTNIDYNAKLHFPLCMKHIHDRFRSEHHLKYGGRLQYSLFLKEIGLSLDENLELFQNEFLKKMEEKMFKRKYAYSIKHLYGEVGRRVEKPAYKCDQIIESSVSCRDEHGCPFAHWDTDKLETTLHKNLIVFGKLNSGIILFLTTI